MKHSLTKTRLTVALTVALALALILAPGAMAQDTAKSAEAPAADAAEGAKPRVALETTKGRIVLELEPTKTPATVKNFLAYVESGFYEGTIFHRVIPNFMVQGGGFTADMTKKDTREPVQNEAKQGLSNLRGTIAMARTRDPHSATAQFFVSTVDNTRLDPEMMDPWGYTAFGRVLEGMDVIDAIGAVETTYKNGMGDVPAEPVVIQKAVILE